MAQPANFIRDPRLCPSPSPEQQPIHLQAPAKSTTNHHTTTSSIAAAVADSNSPRPHRHQPSFTVKLKVVPNSNSQPANSWQHASSFQSPRAHLCLEPVLRPLLSPFHRPDLIKLTASS
ncbi:hypothetical protein M0R45_001215 [Rubus argutus]|uniref:Uncharacterized protein n=1 Tax=Rubus argutus TaxID=59490 RepID=A0AAW1VL98_RUBAR